MKRNTGKAIDMSTLGRYSRLIFIILTCTLGTAALTACEEQGPLEEAGEAADEAINDAERAAEDAAD
jgi:hypothetical protein